MASYENFQFVQLKNFSVYCMGKFSQCFQPKHRLWLLVRTARLLNINCIKIFNAEY